MVSKFAREHVKVVLSGDGGDELFGGYDWYLADNLSTIYSNIPPRIRDVLSKLLSLIPYSRRKKGLINMLKKFQSGFEYPDHLGHLRWNMYSSIADKKSIYTDELYGHLKGIEPYDAVNLHIKKVQSMNRSYRNMYVDLKTWIPDDILLKTDKMSMAVSLEARVPMMDHELVEFSMAIPPSLKIKGKKTKMILKTAMKDFLPDQIINRKDKLGFSIPLKEWLRNKSNDHLMSYLSEESLKAHGLFNYKHITKLIQDHQMRKVDNSQKLFSLLAFEIWRNHCYK